MTDLSFFLSLETRVWQALVDGDGAADRALLADDFLGVYSTGFAIRDDHSGQLADGPTVARFDIRDARLMPLGPGRVLLAYFASFTRVAAPAPEAMPDSMSEAMPESMYVSSIWENRDGIWLNTFSQDSNAADPAPV